MCFDNLNLLCLPKSTFLIHAFIYTYLFDGTTAQRTAATTTTTTTTTTRHVALKHCDLNDIFDSTPTQFIPTKGKVMLGKHIFWVPKLAAVLHVVVQVFIFPRIILNIPEYNYIFDFTI